MRNLFLKKEKKNWEDFKKEIESTKATVMNGTLKSQIIKLKKKKYIYIYIYIYAHTYIYTLKE